MVRHKGAQTIVVRSFELTSQPCLPRTASPCTKMRSRELPIPFWFRSVRMLAQRFILF